ncbi:DUF523 domain-containing protein [Cohnella nanjingensis]|uniref:DUF523 domain-containing protein n=1 Tax=Cohnella nanjingensis TaxID=1387779 RepID=A0A7X0RPD6_9BACL|nr:DUF523 domain-containing protein [Cohnella nanjingensis]MBB6671238.1 DUF523 domain-containing protein [Cohnella nanjingensis]
MTKILVSACLLGQKVRYDSKGALCGDERFQKWYDEGRFMPICPEVTGGLPTPRPPAEIRGDRVVTAAGEDFTAAFEAGAQAALKLAQEHGVAFAILKQNSPSCGSLHVYDGSFTGAKVAGEGRTAALLRLHGFKVFGEDQLDEAERELAASSGSG